MLRQFVSKLFKYFYTVAPRRYATAACQLASKPHRRRFEFGEKGEEMQENQQNQEAQVEAKRITQVDQQADDHGAQ